MPTIRRCIAYARDCLEDSHPFSTSWFQTDGKTIFLASTAAYGDDEILDLKSSQYQIKTVIERTFKDLDIENDPVRRWRPFKGKDTIVIDPGRAFGQPILAGYGVPTVALAKAVIAEGSINRAAILYEVPAGVARDVVSYEQSLQAA